MSFAEIENRKDDEVKANVTFFSKMLTEMKKLVLSSLNFRELVKKVKGVKANTLLDVLEFRFGNSNELFSIGTFFSRRAYMDKLETADLEDSDDEYDEDTDQDYDTSDASDDDVIKRSDGGYDSDTTVDRFDYNESVDEFRSRCKLQHLMSKILWLRRGAQFVLDNIEVHNYQHITIFQFLIKHRENVLCAVAHDMGGEFHHNLETKYRNVKKGLDCLYMAYIFENEFERSKVIARIDNENKAIDDFIITRLQMHPNRERRVLNDANILKRKLSTSSLEGLEPLFKKMKLVDDRTASNSIHINLQTLEQPLAPFATIEIKQEPQQALPFFNIKVEPRQLHNILKRRQIPPFTMTLRPRNEGLVVKK